MNCKEIEIWLYDYVEGRISDSQKSSIEKHLSTCNDCKMQLRVMKETLSVIEEQKALIPADDMDSLVLNTLLSNDDTKIIRLNTFRWIQQIAAVILIAFSIGSGIFIGNSLYQPTMYTSESNFWSNELYIENTGSLDIETILYE
ncbi:MAG: zf-HC2 domain-containing protein [Bacteroidales bacterium]|nr:zf-HC2 domain-containing protein [Bacteroidales bacterium]